MADEQSKNDQNAPQQAQSPAPPANPPKSDGDKPGDPESAQIDNI